MLGDIPRRRMLSPGEEEARGDIDGIRPDRQGICPHGFHAVKMPLLAFHGILGRQYRNRTLSAGDGAVARLPHSPNVRQLRVVEGRPGLGYG